MSITLREFIDAHRRIQMAFMEMPELKMTRAQVRRLLNLSIEASETAIATLTQGGFLTESLDGFIVRSSTRTHGQSSVDSPRASELVEGRSAHNHAQRERRDSDLTNDADDQRAPALR